MYSKTIDGVTGHGIDSASAEKCAVRLLILNDVSHLQEFDEYKRLREELHPWTPTDTTLHIKNIGNIFIKDSSLYFNEDCVCDNLSSTFGILYNTFLTKMSIDEFVACYYEIYDFFRANGYELKTNDIMPPISAYNRELVSDDLDYIIVTGMYEFMSLNGGEIVGMKSSTGQYFFCCEVKDNTIKEIFYYISCMYGFSSVQECLE